MSEVVQMDIKLERLGIEFPGWSGGKARLHIGATARPTATRLAGPDDVGVELGGLCC